MALVTGAMLWSQNCSADLLPEGMLSGHRLTAGVTVNLVEFDVYNRDSTDPNGTLSQDFSYAPIFRLGGPYNFIGKSNWGGMLEYSFTTFKLDQQLVDDQLVDLGTSVDGYYVFVTPALFYSFGQSLSAELNRNTLIAGLGVGLGYLNASGDIRFTETTGELHAFDVSGLALAISLFVDFRRGEFASRLSGGLTTYSKGDFDYDSFGFEWEFSYVFDL